MYVAIDMFDTLFDVIFTNYAIFLFSNVYVYPSSIDIL